ncbi:MAG: DUF6452 family protein [Algibacter sp.]|uniref:DUF6452 family protein n=1 Tax=Algibacter sp. TaxID=1872428 RepID=UPI002638A6D7|nr:DUF6452 family protein [Algibacter sp.]MDG1729381.1 DUF6452 family protein [Algibacter sp.]MDG2178593.1 DUF6452 family protein [Algibacter sp.]
MKKTSLLLITLILAISNYSCERDDICPASTPTTPRLLIDLLDSANSDNSKNVFDLVVIGADNENFLPGYIFQDTDNLVLPLKTDDNTTEYILVKEATVNDAGTPDDTADDFIDGNQDRIIINYSREQVFVSRACGFKTIFKNVTLTIVDDGDNWMLSRQPLTDNQSVEDETTTHFNISH